MEARNAEPDDNTLDNAGKAGRDFADALSDSTIALIERLPHSEKQRVAIARIIAGNLDNYAEETER